MISSPAWLHTVGTVLLVLSALLWITVVRRARRKLPPGPRGIPLLGSVHKLPSAFQEKTFWEWGKRYGDVIYIQLFRTPTIVLNSIEAARELLDKRSSKYSDRPRMVLFAEMAGQDSALPAVLYGERLRRYRRWLYDGIGNKNRLRSYRDIQHREVRILVRNLSNSPARFYDHIHLYLAAILVEVTYGKRVNSLDDQLVRVAERGIESSNATGSPGSMLVDFFPILKHIPSWFPGAGFKRNAMVARECVEAWRNLGYDVFSADFAAGTAAPCIFTSIMTEYDGSPSPAEIEDLKGLAFNVYGGIPSLSLSRGTLLMFLLHMTRNPRVFQKAQEEMDKVVGNERLPDFSDRESLPYLDAVLEEVYRWNPSLPLAVPHRTLVADEYRGFEVPAGCMVIANTWAMTRDSRYYPEPEEFRPERYLTPDGQKRDDVLRPSSFVFGYGRRICPGQAFADASIYLAVANIIALFDIRKVVDEAGYEITPPAEFISGFTSQPAPFVCQIRPRSEKTIARIARLEAET
ncbi:cytochrome P450 [Trametes punicea]|nr:cytochrome P450 [Trametes punicea]